MCLKPIFIFLIPSTVSISTPGIQAIITQGLWIKSADCSIHSVTRNTNFSTTKVTMPTTQNFTQRKAILCTPEKHYVLHCADFLYNCPNSTVCWYLALHSIHPHGKEIGMVRVEINLHLEAKCDRHCVDFRGTHAPSRTSWKELHIPDIMKFWQTVQLANTGLWYRRTDVASMQAVPFFTS